MEKYDFVVVGDESGAVCAAVAGACSGLSVCWIRTHEALNLPIYETDVRYKALGFGPFFRLSHLIFHFSAACDEPEAQAAWIATFTNLTQIVAVSIGAVERDSTGAIRSCSYMTTDGMQHVEGRFWADAGALGLHPDGVVVEERDLVEHIESLEGTVSVAGDFDDLHFVPFAAFTERGCPNAMVAGRHFAATEGARKLMHLCDETDAQAGQLSAWTAWVFNNRAGVTLDDLKSFDRNFCSLYWDMMEKSIPLGIGPKFHAGRDAYSPPSIAQRESNPLKALQCVREGDVYVIPSGEYYLEKPLVFGPQDSGKQGEPLILDGRGKVTISGGRPVSEWQVQPDGSWKAAVPWAKTRPFRTLSVNGVLRDRARYPKTGFTYAEKDDLSGEYSQAHGPHWRYFWREGDFNPDWKNPENGEVVSYTLWTDTHLQVMSVDRDAKCFRFRYPAAKAIWGTPEKWWGKPHVRFENFLEIMNQPGEWYLDRTNGFLHYRPMAGETPDSVKVVAASLDSVIEFNGEDDKVCHDIILRGVRIADQRYFLPRGEVNDMQASEKVRAAVRFTHARNCAIEDSVIENVGGYAVEMRGGVHSCAIRRSSLVHLGAGGVHITGGNYNVPLFDRCVGNEVSDCEIADYGRDFASACGILQRVAEGSKLIYNHIHDGYYTGISCGWQWGYGQSSSRDNEIIGNHIHHLGKFVLSDMGGIYTLGIQPGTVLRYNHIHDIQVRAYGSWGIYNDEGSSEILVEKNVCYNTIDGGYNVNYGHRNTVRNNVFGFCSKYQVKPLNRTDPEFKTYFYSNIVIWDEGELFPQRTMTEPPSAKEAFIDYNLYFGPGERWPGQGPGKVYDRHSVWADPKFVDAANRDFRLKADSPAIELGFEPFDINELSGPRNNK